MSIADSVAVIERYVEEENTQTYRYLGFIDGSVSRQPPRVHQKRRCLSKRSVAEVRTDFEAIPNLDKEIPYSNAIEQGQSNSECLPCFEIMPDPSDISKSWELLTCKMR